MIEILTNSWIMALPFFLVAVLSVPIHLGDGEPIDLRGVTGCLVVSFVMGFIGWALFSDLTRWDQIVASFFGNGVLMYAFYQYADD